MKGCNDLRRGLLGRVRTYEEMTEGKSNDYLGEQISMGGTNTRPCRVDDVHKAVGRGREQRATGVSRDEREQPLFSGGRFQPSHEWML